MIKVDKLVSVVNGKLDICSDLEYRKKGDEYYISLENVGVDFDWREYNNDIYFNTNRFIKEFATEESLDSSVALRNIKNGIFKVENIITKGDRKVCKVIFYYENF